MALILNIRPFSEDDLSSSNPYLPEADEYYMYMGALQDDLKQLDGVVEVTRFDSSFSIETNDSISEAELMKKIKPVFTEDLMKKLRFVSFG